MCAAILIAGLLTFELAAAEEQKAPADPPAMSKMQSSVDDMSNMGNMKEILAGADDSDNHPAGDGASTAMAAMQDRHMNMGAHMKMTHLRERQAGDQARADKIVDAARQVAAQYRDYRLALQNGYHIFLPNVAQKQYHFTNNAYAIEAAFRFNPEHPTSLLYQKNGDDYKLIGVMYTAPRQLSEDELNQRIPLSIAQWHEHVNFCLPPKERRREMLGPNQKFGLAGPISTPQDCESAGGHFYPVIFGWMVHVYPLEQNPQEVWSLGPQHDHGHGE